MLVLPIELGFIMNHPPLSFQYIFKMSCFPGYNAVPLSPEAQKIILEVSKLDREYAEQKRALQNMPQSASTSDEVRQATADVCKAALQSMTTGEMSCWISLTEALKMEEVSLTEKVDEFSKKLEAAKDANKLAEQKALKAEKERKRKVFEEHQRRQNEDAQKKEEDEILRQAAELKRQKEVEEARALIAAAKGGTTLSGVTPGGLSPLKSKPVAARGAAGAKATVAAAATGPAHSTRGHVTRSPSPVNDSDSD